MSKKIKNNKCKKVFTQKKRGRDEKEDRVVLHALNLAKLKIPFRLIYKYKQDIDLLWKTNVTFEFDDLTEKEKVILEKIEFKIVYFLKENCDLSEENLEPFLLFIIDKDYVTKDLKKIVTEKGDIDFAERIMNCMYSDLGILPDFDGLSDRLSCVLGNG